MILDLRANQAGVDMQRPDPRDGFHRRPKKQNPLAVPHYSLSEIQAYLELKLPKIKSKREKLENDRVILRQLLANVDRNRVKIRTELNDIKDSTARRAGIGSIKQRIDD